MVIGNGRVLARNEGTATITTETDNGKKAVCRVTVREPLYKLFVWMKSGEKTGYLSTDKPQFSIEGENIHFSTNKTTFMLPAADVLKFTMEDAEGTEATTVGQTEREQVLLHLKQGEVSICGLPVGGEVRIVDMAGRVLHLEKAGTDGMAVLPLGGFPQGIYIIQTETTTFKIQKK